MSDTSRPCSTCGEPVANAARVAVLTAAGEVWRHPACHLPEAPGRRRRRLFRKESR